MNTTQNTLYTDEDLLKALKKLLPQKKKKAAQFRGNQRPIIQNILAGNDVLAIMPTGSGKSMCYQVPALLLPGITIVITPLLALMEDQVDKLSKAGQSVACLSSNFYADFEGIHYINEKPAEETESKSSRFIRNRIYKDAVAGKYKFLYVTPERLQTGSFLRFAERADISLIAVDEAHCISLWGYEFRPRYLEIARLLSKIKNRPTIAAFTATATAAARQDIIDILKMQNPQIMDDDFSKRDNLNFSVLHMPACQNPGEVNPAKMQALLSYLRSKTYMPKRKREKGFVYCSTVTQVNDVYTFLKDNHLPVTRYFANLDNTPRKRKIESKTKNYQDFESSKKPIMVTTNALGMGIDIEDIRFVIHFNMPTSLENYYQEAGRAGRDGAQADCILYYAEEDKSISQSLIEKSIQNSELSSHDQAIRQKVADKLLAYMTDYAEQGVSLDSHTLQGNILTYFHKNPYDTLDVSQSDYEVTATADDIQVFYANRTLIAQKIRKGQMEGSLVIGRSRKTSAPYTVTYQVTGQPLTYFDLMVADAVYTLMKHRVPVIYTKYVIGLLSGKKEVRLDANRHQAVEASIRKMMHTHIMINRIHSRNYGFAYDDQKGDILEGPFLPLWEKKRGFGYQTDATPPLYQYAEIMNGQFFSFPTAYLRMQDSVPGFRASIENLMLIHYILCRIDTMPPARKNEFPRSMTSRILRLDTLLERLHIDFPDDTSHKNRDIQILWDTKIIKILEHLKNVGYIKDFKGDFENKRIEILNHFILENK